VKAFYIGDLFSFQGAIWARTTKPIDAFGRAIPGQGAGNQTTFRAASETDRWRRSTLWLYSAVSVRAQNKGAASWWKRLLDGPRTFESPGHPVKGASVARLAEPMA
jgi:hypothetical protein